MSEPEPDWRCAGCGVLSPGRVRACDCLISCLYDRGDLKAQSLKTDEAMAIFMRWVNEGPPLALAAGVYVGIKIYASEDEARKKGDIS